MRSRRGAWDGPRRRLSVRQAWAAHRLRRLGVTQRTLAGNFDVSEATINAVANGRSWVTTTALSAAEVIAATSGPERPELGQQETMEDPK